MRKCIEVMIFSTADERAAKIFQTPVRNEKYLFIKVHISTSQKRRIDVGENPNTDHFYKPMPLQVDMNKPTKRVRTAGVSTHTPSCGPAFLRSAGPRPRPFIGVVLRACAGLYPHMQVRCYDECEIYSHMMRKGVMVVRGK